jgi:hypothetical protein
MREESFKFLYCSGETNPNTMCRAFLLLVGFVIVCSSERMQKMANTCNNLSAPLANRHENELVVRAEFKVRIFHFSLYSRSHQSRLPTTDRNEEHIPATTMSRHPSRCPWPSSFDRNQRKSLKCSIFKLKRSRPVNKCGI